ncbi:hypothetical protein NMG60_11031173 [Bertholletia excelsa]
MRIVDVDKCWPFSGKEDIEASLPPIEVKKFRWWSEELQLIVESEEDEIRPRALGFGESSPPCNDHNSNYSKNKHTKNNNKMEVEVALDLSSKKKMVMKSRAPKKRSIVELFAVSPQVVDDIDDDDDEEVVNNSKILASRCCKEKVKRRRKKKKKMRKMKDETIIKKRTDNVKKSGRDCGTLLVQPVADKKKACKIKLKSSITSSGRLNNLSCGQGLWKDILDDTSAFKKKPRLKCFTRKKKSKLTKTTKMIKNQKLVFPVRGILKNSKMGNLGEHSTVFNSQIFSQVNQFDISKADRHVRFSNEDDIPGLTRKPFPCVEEPKFQHICMLDSQANYASSVNYRSMERGKHNAVADMNVIDKDISVCKENETGVHPVTEVLSSYDHLGIPNFSRPQRGFQEHFSDTSATVNHVSLQNENSEIFKQGYRDLSFDDAFTCHPRFCSLPKGGHNPCANAKIATDIFRAPDPSGRLVEYLTGDLPSSAAAEPSTKAYPHHWLSFFNMNGNATGRLSYPSQKTIAEFNSQPLQHQPLSGLSQKELLHNVCSLPHWRQREDKSGKQFMDEDFCGLPLNSQGELVQLDSSCKGVLDQLVIPTIAATGSSRNSAMHDILIKRNLELSEVKDNSSGSGAPKMHQLQAFAIKDHAKSVTSRASVSSLDSMGGSNYSVYEKQNHTGDDKDHQQGKPDLVHLPWAVPQSTMRLMGKEFVVGRSEHDQSNTVTDSGFQQDFIVCPALRKSQENVACLSDVQISQVSKSEQQIRPPGFRFSYNPNLNCNIDISGHQNYYPNISRNCVHELPSYLTSNPSPPLFAQTPLFRDPYICGYGVSKVSLQIPKLAPNSFGDMSSSSIVKSTYSHLHFAVLRAQNLGGRHHSYIAPNSSFPTVPYVRHAVEASYPYHASSSCSATAMQSSPGSASFSHPSLMQFCHGFPLTSSINEIHGNRIQIKERMRPRIHAREPEWGKKSRKRPADKAEDDSPELTKIPNLKVHEYSSSETGLKANTAVTELDIIRNRESGAGCSQVEILTDGFEISGKNLDGFANHVHTDMTNQDNRRPIHSTTPAAAANASVMVAEAEIVSPGLQVLEVSIS